jgi:hypothetical protein
MAGRSTAKKQGRADRQRQALAAALERKKAAMEAFRAKPQKSDQVRAAVADFNSLLAEEPYDLSAEEWAEFYYDVARAAERVAHAYRARAAEQHVRKNTRRWR